MLRSALTKRIIELKKEKKLSQVKFAKIINVSQGYMNRIEKGGAFLRLEQIEMACEAFGINPIQLFSDIINKPQSTPNLMQRREDAIPGFEELRQQIMSLPEAQRLAVIAHVKSTIDLIVAGQPKTEDSKKKMA